ncbi:LOW QUALITY PROTEIN: hypothetical protein MAR_002775 [Mya arenaria]|uniref:Uncharacterized protein n=1 Tax=Mya arenaria TaxID=6604 RepID=A0ABY7G5K5_MYAAR|nr:LOW QUALITY PROTEIN: hypothetical protein MAR_002775 [Mya arenaria]
MLTIDSSFEMQGSNSICNNKICMLTNTFHMMFKWRQLFTVMRILKGKCYKCSIVADRLYVNGQLHDVNKYHLHLYKEPPQQCDGFAGPAAPKYDRSRS